MFKNKMRIISLVRNRNAHYLKKTHNFGIEFPKSVAQEYTLDKNNGDTLWEYSISKWMKDVSPAFSKLENEETLPIGYHHVN